MTPPLSSVRPAGASDVPVILQLVRELAIYEREPDAVVASEADFLRDGFGATPRFEVLLAEEEVEGRPVVQGLALFFTTWSTWRGRPVLFLEDLFVRPGARKRGHGLALMRALAGAAVARGCARFEWHVLDWNVPAITFYESLGAKVLPEWRTVRMDAEALDRFAAS